MKPKLLPCPFCGSEAASDNGFSPCESVTYAWCNNQECHLHLIGDAGLSQEEWNTRAPAQPAQVHGWQMVMPPSPYCPELREEMLTDYEIGELQGRCDMWEEVKRLNAAAPQPSDDVAKDAARYRWLRDPCSGAEKILHYSRGDYGKGLKSGEWLDAAIDAAMTGGRK